MPESYKGKETKECGYTKTKPRVWTKQEIEWCKTLKEQGYTIEEISQSIGRSKVSLQTKLKRIGKKENRYNKKHVIEKYETNNKFIDLIKPNTILDVYAGERNWYKEQGYNVVTNDINKNFNTDYHMDALKFMCTMYAEGKKFDIVDLDPYGSAYDLFDLAIKTAKKGIVVTFGEIGHKRWKRLDFLKTHYGIEKLEDITTDNLINEIQKIAKKNKKILHTIYKKEWKNISRVYFKIDKIKVLEQWGGEK